jgi:hypothetical protein
MTMSDMFQTVVVLFMMFLFGAVSVVIAAFAFIYGLLYLQDEDKK